MLEALIAGQRDPAALADLAKRRMRSKMVFGIPSALSNAVRRCASATNTPWQPSRDALQRTGFPHHSKTQQQENHGTAYPCSAPVSPTPEKTEADRSRVGALYGRSAIGLAATFAVVPPRG